MSENVNVLVIIGVRASKSYRLTGYRFKIRKLNEISVYHDVAKGLSPLSLYNRPAIKQQKFLFYRELVRAVQRTANGKYVEKYVKKEKTVKKSGWWRG